ncbi:unnamed protein product [Nesidiocoris tenuis]|uniref:Medium-chain acyl-CoA ligase ACSF2, mitochondrial n=1 Tax=Nesidiocoris tenuis TaxID=355587 RepID=A0A6H5H9E3_9HEMI|nr:unnamed protein product [Nesidiocoris tenuis]
MNRKLAVFSLFVVRRYSKLSYFHNPSSEPLRALTFGQLIDSAAAKWQDRKAIVFARENRELTFAEARMQAQKLGAGLLKLGMKPGDRIATFGGNTFHWYVTALAAAKTGLILTGLNPNYQKDELLFTLQKVGVKAIVADEEYKSTNFYDLLTAVVPELSVSPVSTSLSSKSLPNLKYVILASEKHLPGSFRFEDLLNSADSTKEVDDIDKNLQPDHPLNIQFTSGTTGTPKAALLSSFGIVNNAHFFGKRCGFHKHEHATLCIQVPFFHVFGYALAIVCAMSHGNALVITGPSFNKNDTIKALMKHKCTAIYGTPTMYVDVCAAINEELKKENEDLKASLMNFNVIVSGGALCSPQLFTAISHTFNCTNLQVKVVDGEGKMVPFGTPGEAWFRSYSKMLGYWDDEERTKEIITSCGWLKSGDQLILTEQGYGTIVGRLKEQINRGGEKIMPSEIEKILETHPKIQEVHVHAVSDYRMGEEICACIKTTKGAALSEDDVKAFCKDKLSRFKIPRYVRFVEEFPKTGSGKIKKFELRQTVEEELKNQSKQQ